MAKKCPDKAPFLTFNSVFTPPTVRVSVWAPPMALGMAAATAILCNVVACTCVTSKQKRTEKRVAGCGTIRYTVRIVHMAKTASCCWFLVLHCLQQSLFALLFKPYNQ